jgi:WD40 repeat protein
MPFRSRHFSLSILAALVLPYAGTGAEAELAKTATRSMPLSGVSGRIDHLSLDAAGHRLFIAALGNNTVEAVDLRTGRRLRSLGGMDEPQGIAFVPPSHRLYVANGGDGKVLVFDARSFERLRTIDLGDDADNVRFDPVRNRAYVGYGEGGIAAIEDSNGTLAWRASLPGHPESFQYERSGSRLFVNVPDAREITVIDKDQGRVLEHWKTGDLRSNFPMALDESGHRLFVGFRNPPVLGIFDTESGKLRAREVIHRDADDVFWDSASSRLYLACGEGFLDRFERVGPEALRRLDPISTPSGARTGLLDPGGKVFYLAVPKRWGATAEVRGIPLE